ncbi:VOC family protein [Aquicella lusitana]|uniref:PhnB protein n=1 Tax=Aquicella lusitana TaxID=254246 RepID=A0A370G7K7_9COXI|nr:VOC family protein [Aquicella lusitana]RDI39066.1 PhnB protein [Aquicella lusitana]VVC73673.1 hypothetical protein AQULUS_14200 [Aquicella lusitana]
MAKAKKKTKMKKKVSVTKRLPGRRLKKKTAAKKKIVKPKKKIAKSRKKAVKGKKKKLSVVPQGYNSITPYLIVNNAAKAIEFYKKLFDAKEVMRMDQPDGKVGHAELRIGDAKIMLADEYPEMDARAPEAFGGSPVGIHLYIKEVDTVVEKALRAGSTLMRPVETMFYGDRTGTLIDPYGHKWYVSTHVENVSAAEMKKRAEKLFGSKSQSA